MQIIKNSAIYLGASILNKAIPLLLLPILTEYLTQSEFGILSLFQVLISFSNALVGMAINANVSKNFFHYDKKRLAISIGNMLIILCCSTLLVLLITWGFTIMQEALFSVPRRWVRVIPLLSFMFMVNTINLTIFRMEQKAFKFGVFEVANTLINVGATLILLIFYEFGWYSRAVGILLAYLVFFVLSFGIMFKTDYVDLKFSKRESNAILKMSLPMIPHAIGSIIIAMSDRLFIEKMVGLKEVGIYTVGYMFGMLVLLFTEAFLKAWNPWFFKMMAKGTREIKEKVVFYTYSYLVFVIVLTMMVSVISKFIIPYFVDERYFDAIKYVPWIAIGYTFFGVYQIFFPYLVYLNKTYFLAISTTVAAILNLLLNYFLIDAYGTIGAAYATIIAFAISSAMVYFFQKRHCRMPWFSFDLKQRLRAIRKW